MRTLADSVLSRLLPLDVEYTQYESALIHSFTWKPHLRRQFALFGTLSGTTASCLKWAPHPADFCCMFTSLTMASPLVCSLSWLLHNIFLSTCRFYL